MISKQINEKGILAKLLEKAINIILKRECNKIGELRIDIKANSIQIVKGIIPKINIFAKDIDYKSLLFDEIEIEGNNIKIIFNILNKKLNLENNFIVEFKISLSQKSIQAFLLADDWNWIREMIGKEILNQDTLENIIIKNDQIFLKGSRNEINESEKIEIEVIQGQLYLRNKATNKAIKIPIEDKVIFKNINIQNNLIFILAKSSVSL